MRAGQVTRPRHVEVVDVPHPGDPVPGSCLVRTDYLGICGSDVRRGYRPQAAAYPLPPGFPGHECIGTIEASAASGFSKGDRVLMHPAGLLGLQEYVVLPADRLALVPEPQAEPFRWLMCEPASTVLHALHRSPSPLGKRVAVVGQGTMGLIWTTLLRRLGAMDVHTADLEPSRLEMSQRQGASSVSLVPADRQDDHLAYGEPASFDMVVEAAGEVQAIDAAMRLARREGFVVLFGTPAEERVELDYRHLRDHELATLCTAPGQGVRIGAVMQQMVDLVARDWVDLSPLVTHTLPFEEVDRAFAMADARQDGSIRVVVEF